jgi:hypothetical protein
MHHVWLGSIWVRKDTQVQLFNDESTPWALSGSSDDSMKPTCFDALDVNFLIKMSWNDSLSLPGCATWKVDLHPRKHKK